MKILQYLKDLFKLIYPDYCIGCNELLLASEQYLCTACLYDMPVTYYHNNPENCIKTQFAELVDLQFATACYFFRDGSTFRKLIHKLKYGDRPNIGLFIGMLCARPIQKELQDLQIDYIIPVPMHPKKQKERGYNQAERIAQGISNIIQTPILTNAIIRTAYGPSQTSMQHKNQRKKNIEGAFSATNTCLLANKHILLIDDVFTTGATLEACITSIMIIPNIRISILTAGVSHNL